MESELCAALSEYRSQLEPLEQLLVADPDNVEARQLYDQLLEAVQYTESVLAQVQQQQQPGDGGGWGDGGAVAEASTFYPHPLDCGLSTVATVRPLPAAPGDEAGMGTGSAVAEMEAEAEAAEAGGGGPPRPLPRGGAPNNARMHPANRYYHSEPDFAALAARYDALAPYVTTDAAGRAHLDTASWAATRALTAALLHADFGLAWDLPGGQLVPPVPNRANYVHWLHDLLQLSAPAGGGHMRGLDIGCGANFIYCLLGAVLYGWHMVGVDVTQVAVSCCRKLIRDNPQVAPLLEVRDLSALHPEMQLPGAATPAGAPEPGGGGGGRRGRKRHVLAGQEQGQGQGQAAEAAEDGEQLRMAAATVAAETEGGDPGGAPGAEAEGDDGGAGGGVEAGEAGALAAEAVAAEAGEQPGILLPAFRDDSETFAFSMCNPPFFESMQEAAQNPNTAFGGTAAEMVCPGGELAFVLRMLAESEELRERVHWFSTMVGKKTTLKALRRELHSRHVTALRTTELAQGRTSRWAVAWSWQVDPNKASQPLRRHPAAAAAATGAAAAVGGGGGEEPQQGPGADDDYGGGGGGAAAAAAADAVAAATAVAARCHAAAPPPAQSLAAAGMAALPRRYVSFTVQQAGAQAGTAVLRRLQQLLSERGCGALKADPAAWSLEWPLQVGPFSPGEPSGADAGAPAAAGTKRPRDVDAGAGGDGGGGGGGGSWASNLMVRLRLAQQQRGRVEVVATIPNSAPDAAARAFAGLMASLQLALAPPQ